MKQIYSMYRMVKMVQKLSLECNAKDFPEPTLTGRYYQAPLLLAAKHFYSEKYKVTFEEAGDVCDDAINKRYLDVHNKIKNKKKIDVLVVTTKGRELTDSVAGLPLGFLNAAFKRYAKLAMAIFGFAGGVLVTIVAKVTSIFI